MKQAIRLAGVYHSSGGARVVIGLMLAGQGLGYFAAPSGQLTTSYQAQAALMPLGFYAWALIGLGLALAATAPRRFGLIGRSLAALATGLAVLYTHAWIGSHAWTAAATYMYLAIFFAIQCTYIVPE